MFPSCYIAILIIFSSEWSVIFLEKQSGWDPDERRNILSHKWFTFTFCVSCNFETILFKYIHGEAEPWKGDYKEIIFFSLIFVCLLFPLPFTHSSKLQKVLHSQVQFSQSHWWWLMGLRLGYVFHHFTI